jgi:hypothetical protein
MTVGTGDLGAGIAMTLTGGLSSAARQVGGAVAIAAGQGSELPLGTRW